MWLKHMRLLTAAAFAGLLCDAPVAFAQTAPNLGAAQSFAVLSGTASVSNTGSTVLNGDLGTSGVAGITGFLPGIVNGSVHNGDALAGQAQLAAITAPTSALNDLQGRPCTFNYPLIADIGGAVLPPGVHCFPSSAAITGTVQLDAQNDPNAVFIFVIGTTLGPANSSVVQLIRGAQACNVFWAVGSSATIGSSATFVGNVLAELDITGVTGAHSFGRLLAGRAVVLDTNVVDATVCAAVAVPGVPGVPVPGVPVPGAPIAICPPSATQPTITTIPSQVIPTLPVNGSVAVGFTIGGGVIADALTVTATSSNATLVPPSAMVITRGLLGARVLTIFGADGRTGTATITVTVSDPYNCSTSTTFQLTIGTAVPVPTLPEWAMIALATLLVLTGIAAMRRRTT